MKDKFWNVEKLIGLSALLISMFTLGVFIYQTNLIRKQQYMSVYPHLHISNSGTGSLEYEFQLQNEGVGPAFIRELKIISPQGKSFEDFIDYVENELPQERDSIWYNHSNIYVGQLIQPGEVISIIKLIDNERILPYDLPLNTHEGSHKLWEVLNHDSLRFEITYESIYGEGWTINDGSRSPIKN